MPLGHDDAFRLMMEGQAALSRVEANGLRVDVPYLDRMIIETGAKIAEMEENLKKDDVWATWTRVFRDKANLTSADQLGHVIFEVMGVPCTKRTPTGRPKTDAEALEQVDHPWVQRYVTCGQLRHVRRNNLIGIRDELVGDHLHPIYSLNTVKTFRGSGSYPNPQNFPNRDKRRARLVRTAFIPTSDDYAILEMDMSGAEVRTSACYHKDATMISYIERNHDYHKDLATQCFKLKPEQVTKLVRGTAKNMFVFASFYGDWFVNIAQNMWMSVKKDKLTTVDGVPLYDHLRANGIEALGNADRDTVPGTFMHHIKEVYDDFWSRRFAGYSAWKVEWWNAYLQQGFFHTLTGFTCKGILRRNEAINYPIQGSSFHCLLWVLIEMDKWLRKYHMKTKIIGQIHDSILFDAYRKELQDVVAKCHELMVHSIRLAWDWIIVPLEVEAEVGETNWWAKEKYELPSVSR